MTLSRAHILAASIASACLTPLASHAQSAAQSQAEELADIERRLESREAEEQRLQEEAAAREQEAASLRQRLIETANTLQEAERRKLAIENEIIELEDEEAVAAADFSRQQDHLGDVLAALQALELARPPALLVSPDDANEAARAAMLLSSAAPELEAKAADLRNAVNKLATAREKLAEERAALDRTNVELSARRDVLSELVRTKERERDVAARLAAAAQAETASLAARATTLRDVIRRLQRLAHSVTPRLKPPAPSAPNPIATNTNPGATSAVRPSSPIRFNPARTFASAKGALKSPVVGSVAGRFGESKPDGGRFEGLRFKVRDKALVTAPFEAKIAFAQSWSPFGNLMVLDVGGGYHILLLGVGAFSVEPGQKVAAGEPIAQMDGDGATLDLEIRKDGEPVNPSLWLSRASIEEMGF